MSWMKIQQNIKKFRMTTGNDVQAWAYTELPQC